MNSTPPHLDLKNVRRHLQELPEVCGVHYLHAWNVSSSSVAFSCHVVVPDQAVSLTEPPEFQRSIRRLALGLGYGILSGSCTFGFIAPILAIITVQQEVATGILFILLFAVGHCLPIAVAGSSTAVVRKLVENSAWQGAGGWFRKAAGAVICLLGVYFILNPFLGNLSS